MPTYEYAHKTSTCQHEWEETRSIVRCFPTEEDTCPSCGAKGNITLLVSGGSGRHKVELGRRELIEKTNADAQALRREVYSNENTYANLLGEQRYNELQSRYDRQK